MKQKNSSAEAYRVLARKYRPTRFDELIGQESLVKTLSNALEMGRLAHAFILTGLRGIGKTTTARIIAKGLNCIGEDGQGSPTLSPCGVCSSCIGVAEGRHVDVIEMDAASNTGVDDVREIIDGVGYKPLSARYKIYIIDEVHMLSKSAFNALLKTLEEPPEAVKFIFATTEIRKVPITVLSRCQRFDLRRVPVEMMIRHLASICDKEGITADETALARIARAAEGSVRDALSMLDQAAALTADKINDDHVAGLLGQAGRQDSLEITRHVLKGDAAAAMAGLAEASGRGAEPQMVLADMLELIHLASRLAAGGSLADLPEHELVALTALAEDVGLPRLVRAWQIGLKGHGEMTIAPDAHAATDMVLIRLAHAATMPTPADLVRKLEGQSSTAVQNQASTSVQSVAQPVSQPTPSQSAAPVTEPVSCEPAESALSPDQSDTPAKGVAEVSEPRPDSGPEPESVTTQSQQDATPQSLREMVQLFEDRGELLLASTIRTKLRMVIFEPGRFEFSAGNDLDPGVPAEIAARLLEWTGLRWIVAISSEGGGATVDEQDASTRAREIAQIAKHPLVAATLETFPGAEVSETHEMGVGLNPTREDDDEGVPQEGSAHA
jgi:DNA polymerase-3 subunit gamma/tau